MSERERRPRVLGEYELDGGAFGPVRGGGRRAARSERGEQRDIVRTEPAVRLAERGPEPRFGRGLEHGLARPGSLWRAVLRRLRVE